MSWGEGDSSYDKVRGWGKSADSSISIYRYEAPGPFRLTIEAPSDDECEALHDRVLLALNATAWRRLEPQPGRW
jgi:hypothetical protein